MRLLNLDQEEVKAAAEAAAEEEAEEAEEAEDNLVSQECSSGNAIQGLISPYTCPSPTLPTTPPPPHTHPRSSSTYPVELRVDGGDALFLELPSLVLP